MKLALVHDRFCRGVIAVLLAVSLTAWNGCATLAHRSSYDYDAKKKVTACEHEGEVCPWLIGDAVLLIPFILPGVVAFIVDLGTGAWRHEGFPEDEAVAQGSSSGSSDDGTPAAAGEPQVEDPVGAPDAAEPEPSGPAKEP